MKNESCSVIIAITAVAMDEDNPAESFQDEASCSLCLGFFQDPVSIHCGHNFCRVCITRCWEEEEETFSCPRCKATATQRNLRPNRELAKIIEIAKRLSLRAPSAGERLCERHREVLKLFCEEDQVPICLVCRESHAHRLHAAVPIEEAVEEQKVWRVMEGSWVLLCLESVGFPSVCNVSRGLEDGRSPLCWLSVLFHCWSSQRCPH